MSTQRRTYGFGTPDPSQQTFPRITTPPGHLAPRNDEKSPRLQQRALGVSFRIWVLISVVIFLLLCMHVLTPPSEEPSNNRFSNAHLTPKDYLNVSNDPLYAPFSFCPVYGPGDTLVEKYGVHALARSKLHMGSGARVQRVIRKALSGLPVTISVLGGSGEFLSTCHAHRLKYLRSFCMPWRWQRSHFSQLLPVPLFPMVE